MLYRLRSFIGIQASAGVLLACANPVPVPAVAEDPQPGDPLWNNQVCANPTLPRSVIKNRLQGSVSVLFDVDSEGYTDNVRITETSHDGKMDYSVKRALKRWRYFAYFKDGDLAPRKNIPLTFTYGEAQQDSCTHSSLPERASTPGEISDPYNQLKSCFTLVMPRSMAQDRTEGHVELMYDISPKGRVRNIRVVEASHTDLLADTSRTALSRWTYYPFKKAGKTIARPDMKVRFNFGEPYENTDENQCGYAPWDATHTFSVQEAKDKPQKKGLDGRVNR